MYATKVVSKAAERRIPNRSLENATTSQAAMIIQSDGPNQPNWTLRGDLVLEDINPTCSIVCIMAAHVYTTPVSNVHTIFIKF